MEKVARMLRSEGIPPYKAGQGDRRLWNAGMRGLHDVEKPAAALVVTTKSCHNLVQWDPRLADIFCHLIQFKLRVA